jgi:diguanylate cyclase (GGDEF)-like protein
MAEHVRRRVEDVDIPYPGSSLGGKVTVSVGVATLRPTEGGSTETLVFNADKALYEAKRSGRNRVVRAPVEAPSAPPSNLEPA